MYIDHPEESIVTLKALLIRYLCPFAESYPATPPGGIVDIENDSCLVMNTVISIDLH